MTKMAWANDLLGLRAEDDYRAVQKVRDEVAAAQAAIALHERAVSDAARQIGEARDELRKVRALRQIGEATEQDERDAAEYLADTEKRAADSEQTANALRDALDILAARAAQEERAAHERRVATANRNIQEAIAAAVPLTEKAAAAHRRIYDMERAAHALQLHATRQQNHLPGFLPTHLAASGYNTRTDVDNWIDAQKAAAAKRGEGR